MDAIRDELSELDKQLGNVTAWEEQRLAKIDELVKDDKLTPEQAEKLRENPELAHEEGPIRDALMDAGFIGGSRGDSWLSELIGGIGDELAFLFGGDASNVNGWIDENGEFEFKTCFVAGTLVRVHPDTSEAFLHNGKWYKSIEEIQVGDFVLSKNLAESRPVFKPITHTFVRTTSSIYKITFETEDTVIETTWSHPFYIEGRGWVPARSLQPGDLAITASEKRVGIKEIKRLSYSGNVYNLSVANEHNFFVSEISVLVHNQDPADYFSIPDYIERELSALLDTTWSLLSRTQRFALENPVEAAIIGLNVAGTDNITSTAVRFTTGSGLKEPSFMGGEGTQRNAFRHTLWQATIAERLGEDIAQEVGDAHEPNPKVADTYADDHEFIGLRDGGRRDADSVVDLKNNEIGRRIGADNPGIGMREMSLKVLEEYRTNGLWQIVLVNEQAPGAADNVYKIERIRLSEAEYDQARSEILNRNETGRTKAEQDWLDRKRAFAGKG